MKTAVRRALAASGVVTLAVALVVVAGLPLYVHPHVDAVPEHADAVFVLGPPTPERVDAGRALVDRGVADTLVLSVPASAFVTGTRDHEKFAGCNQPGTALLCFAPTPATTRGEARELAALVRERDWASVVVVTRTAHITRARAIIDRCYTGELAMVSSGETLTAWGWAWQYVYQTAGFLRMATASGC